MCFVTKNLSYFFCSNCTCWSNQTTWHYRDRQGYRLGYTMDLTALHQGHTLEMEGMWMASCLQTIHFPPVTRTCLLSPFHVCCFPLLPTITALFPNSHRCLSATNPHFVLMVFPPKTFSHCMVLAFRYL